MLREASTSTVSELQATKAECKGELEEAKGSLFRLMDSQTSRAKESISLFQMQTNAKFDATVANRIDKINEIIIMSEAQKNQDLAEDKCCFVIPIVPGMKVLSGLMILGNTVALIRGFGIFFWNVPVWLKVAFGLDFVLIGAIVFFLAKWFLNDNSAGRAGMVFGLFLNIIQNAIQGLLVVMAFALWVAPSEKTKEAAEKADEALSQSESAKAAAEKTTDALKAADELTGGAGIAGPIVLLVLCTGLAAYFWSEAKEYQKLADDCKRGDNDDDFHAVAEENE